MKRKTIWKFLMSRRWTILRSEMFTKGYVIPLKKYLGVANKELLVTKEFEQYSLYNSLDSLNEMSGALLKKMRADKNFGRKIYDDCKKSCQNLVRISKMVSRGNLKSISSYDLVTRFDSYLNAALNFTPFLALPPNYELFIVDDINKFLVKKIGENKSEEYLQKLMSLKEYPFQVLEQIGMTKIALQSKEKYEINVDKSLESHKQKYQWLSCYNFDESAFTTDDFKKRLKVLQTLSLDKLKDKVKSADNRLRQDEVDFQKTVNGSTDAEQIQQLDHCFEWMHDSDLLPGDVMDVGNQ